MSSTPERFGAVVAAMGETVRAVPGNGWGGATPCTEWSVRDLVNHVVSECRWMPPLFEGRTIADVGSSLDGDLLGNDPGAAWEGAAAASVAAVRAPGAMQSTVHLSYGDVPGDQYAREIVADLVVHTWDLARAVGANERLDPDLVQAAWDHLAPVAESWRSAGAFSAALDVPENADLQTKLLALTGRRA